MEFALCIVLILASSFLAASEIALFSLSRFQLRLLRDNFRAAHKKIKLLLSDSSGLLVSVLVASEVINVSLSTVIVESISRKNLGLPDWILGDASGIPTWAVEIILGVLCTSPIILIFCEVTPKIIGVQINQLVAPLSAGPMTMLYQFLKPIRRALSWLIWVISPNSHSVDHHVGKLKESEFLQLVEEGQKEGAIQQGEVDLIQNVFELDNTPVSDIATPLSQVLSLSANATVKSALTAIRSQQFSRIPVLSANKKEVIGVLYAKDLLRAKLHSDSTGDSGNIANLMKKPFFVNPDLRLNALFRKFKQNKIHMAIVRTSDGVVRGVITMSDLLDYLFEDFLGEPAEEKRIR